MKLETFYRILSAVLMPIFFFLAFMVLPFALFALGNPQAWLGIFVFVCLLIYMVKSVKFFKRNILLDTPTKAKTRDWIRVNAFVSILFVLELLSTSYMVFSNNENLRNMIQVAINQMQDAGGTSAMPITVDEMLSALKKIMVIFLFVDILLIAHLVCTFKLLKKYKHLLVLE